MVLSVFLCCKQKPVCSYDLQAIIFLNPVLAACEVELLYLMSLTDADKDESTCLRQGYSPLMSESSTQSLVPKNCYNHVSRLVALGG